MPPAQARLDRMRRPLHAVRTFRGEASTDSDPAATAPGAVNDYRPKSMIAEYRILTVVFGIAALALALYFVRSVLRAPKPAPPPVQSVYVDVVPAKQTP